MEKLITMVAVLAEKAPHLLSDSVPNFFVEHGYELAEAEIDDGRPVVHFGTATFTPTDQTWEHWKDEVQVRLQDKIRRTVKNEQTAKVAAVPGESLTTVLCPVCKSKMGKQLICPKCELGKEGFRVLCTCTDCGHDVPL